MSQICGGHTAEDRQQARLRSPALQSTAALPAEVPTPGWQTAQADLRGSAGTVGA